MRRRRGSRSCVAAPLPRHDLTELLEQEPEIADDRREGRVECFAAVETVRKIGDIGALMHTRSAELVPMVTGWPTCIARCKAAGPSGKGASRAFLIRSSSASSRKAPPTPRALIGTIVSAKSSRARPSTMAARLGQAPTQGQRLRLEARLRLLRDLGRNGEKTLDLDERRAPTQAETEIGVGLRMESEPLAQGRRPIERRAVRPQATRNARATKPRREAGRYQQRAAKGGPPANFDPVIATRKPRSSKARTCPRRRAQLAAIGDDRDALRRESANTLDRREIEAALAGFRNGEMMDQNATALGQCRGGGAQGVVVHALREPQASRGVAYLDMLDFYVGGLQPRQTPSGRGRAAKRRGRQEMRAACGEQHAAAGLLRRDDEILSKGRDSVQRESEREIFGFRAGWRENRLAVGRSIGAADAGAQRLEPVGGSAPFASLRRASSAASKPFDEVDDAVEEEK